MTDDRNPTERLFHTLSKHPYFCVIFACALLLPFGLTEKSGLTVGSLFYAAVISGAAIALLVFAGGIGADDRERVVIFGGSFAFCGVSLYLLYATSYSSMLMLFLPLILIAALCIVMRVTGTLSTRNFIVLMVLAGSILRFVYIMYTSSEMRQHDVGYWNWTWGHANYIEYWYNNGLKLPDFDVRTIWQYYHPPLHHMLMALLLRILTQLGVEYDAACQALQILPMMYSSLITVVCYRIFRIVRLKGTPLVVAMALVCFHPTFVLMGGFFNNDILSVLFMLSAMMWALRWYREPVMKNIIPIALCVGLGMMTKLSAWMVAPAIAILFLYVFFCNKRRPWGYIGQFAVFAVICVPLALWWQVRNLILFDVPLTYVPYLGDSNSQFLGNMSAAHRLFYFGGRQLSFVFDAFTDYGAPYNEFNPTLGLIKTSLFSEGHNGISTVNFPQLTVIGPALFWVAVPLFVLMGVAFFVTMFSKRTQMDAPTRVFFAVTYLVLLVSYYLFCFRFPFTCTMNIRYCVPLIPLSAMGLGLLLQTHPSKPLHCVTYTLTGVFIALSMVMFAIIG